MDTGKSSRLKLLKDKAKRDIIDPFEKHNWQCKISGVFERGEYLIVQLSKGDVPFSLGFLYSCATDNAVYKKLDKSVDLIVLNGGFYHLESYAYGISTKVIELGSLQKYIIQWNAAASDGKISLGGQEPPKAKPKEFSGRIQSENPIHQIWSRIRQFRTRGLAEKLILQRCERSNVQLGAQVVKEKAAGLAFCVQNGCDYFETASKQKLNQRIVSLYYGAMAFASAEMAASASGPNSLKRIEKITKQGHGLYTYDSRTDNAFEDFLIGIQANGFFSYWVKFLGCDISEFPNGKPKKNELDVQGDHVTTLVDLFSHIPELEDLFRMVTDRPTHWLNFNYKIEWNGRFGERQKDASYVKITDTSCTQTVEDIANLDLPIEQIEYATSDWPGGHFKVLVNHPNHEHWYGALRQHSSPFTSSSYIIPVFGSVGEYRCIAVVILYALSILVRYRPSIWREVVSGKYENYLALTDEFISVYERMGPQLFLEALLDTQVRGVQSGSMFAAS